MRQIAKRDSLHIFLKEISKYPVLSAEEERELARRYYEEKDLEAAKKLVTSNLRFVVKIASQYEKYGFPLVDLIQEGALGLMNAVKRYDPYKGTRLISYAIWWIKAYIYNYIMRSWSLVKIGTTQAQRKLFQKMSRKKHELNIEGGRELKEEEIARLAEAFDVTEGDIIDMELRTSSRDLSLDSPATEDSSLTYLDMLEYQGPSHEQVLESAEMDKLTRQALADGMEILTPRERYVIEKRYNTDNPMKLRELGCELNISKERVRQIESSALLKLRTAITKRLNQENTVDLTTHYIG